MNANLRNKIKNCSKTPQISIKIDFKAVHDSYCDFIGFVYIIAQIKKRQIIIKQKRGTAFLHNSLHRVFQ